MARLGILGRKLWSMGILQLTQQKVLIVAGIIAFIAICAVGIITSQRPQPTADVATSYTSSITGRDSVIFPLKGVEMVGNVPEVQLFAAEDFYDRYTDIQASSIVDQLRKFVEGISGGRATVAGIVDGKITNQDAETDTFKLFINRPESTYQVTIVTQNSDQQIPTVTFNRE